MAKFVQHLFFVVYFSNIFSQSVQANSSSNPYHCKEIQYLKDLPVLGEMAGVGFDNLRNIEMEKVVETSYELCKTTEDGRFLIPDSVIVIPNKQSNLQTSVSYFEHFDNFTSTTFSSININPGLKGVIAKISGKFSREYEKIKKRNYIEKTDTMRMQLRHSRYIVRLASRSTLNPIFKKRAERIASFLFQNSTERARYETQLLIRDYGTHVVTRAEIGASLVRNDQLSKTEDTNALKDKQNLKLAAEIFFQASTYGNVSIDFGYESSSLNDMIETYRTKLESTEIYSLGGSIITLEDKFGKAWESTVETNMVALDIAGDPINLFINEDTLPDLPYSILADVSKLVEDEGVKNYYKHNVIKGCTDVTSPNFNFLANVNDGSCQRNKRSFSFGGVYQTCRFSGPVNLCKDLSKTNPLTGEFSCPPGFQSTLINSGDKSETTTKTKEISCGFLYLWTCYDVKDEISRANYEAFWCSLKNKSSEYHLLFGGSFTKYFANVWTRSATCPPDFYSVTILDQLSLCLSQDFELAEQNSLPFGGFYSCKEGNPLAKENVLPGFPHSCPDGFSQHLAYEDDGCAINYCAQSNAVSSPVLPRIQRPPYMEIPPDTPSKVKSEEFGLTKDGDVIDLDEAKMSTESPDGDVSSNEALTTEKTSGGNLNKSNLINTAVWLLLVFFKFKSNL